MQIHTKNKIWQPYAAIVAAAFAKSVILGLRSPQLSRSVLYDLVSTITEGPLPRDQRVPAQDVNSSPNAEKPSGCEILVKARLKSTAEMSVIGFMLCIVSVFQAFKYLQKFWYYTRETAWKYQTQCVRVCH